MTSNENIPPGVVVHAELQNACFPIEADSPIRPELVGPVTLRSRFEDRYLSIYCHAPITRLDHEGRRIKDIRLESIGYSYQATDFAAPGDLEEVRAEIRRLLSLAGHGGDWRSGVENIRTVLLYYATEDVANLQEFERLIGDAEKFLGTTMRADSEPR